MALWFGFCFSLFLFYRWGVFWFWLFVGPSSLKTNPLQNARNHLIFSVLLKGNLFLYFSLKSAQMKAQGICTLSKQDSGGNKYVDFSLEQMLS